MPVSAYKKLVPAFGTGFNNMGGTPSIAYWAPKGDFLALQDLPASPTNPEDKYVIATAHTFATGGRFYEMYTSQQKGRVQYEALGGEDGNGWKVTFTAFLPSDSKDLTYMANNIRSDWGIFLVPDADGKLNQIGNAVCKPMVTMTFDTETVTGDGKGYMITVVAYMPWKIIYAAAVTTTPAS